MTRMDFEIPCHLTVMMISYLLRKKNVLVFNRALLVFYTVSSNGDVNINVSVFEDMLKSRISECL